MIRSLAILSFLLAIPAAAHDEENVRSAETYGMPQAETAPAEEPEWWAASLEQIRNAPCRRSASFSDEEVSTGIQDLIPKNDRKVSKNVFGIQIENDSAFLVGLLERLLRYDRGFLNTEEDTRKNQKTFRSSCSTVLCAVSDPSIFGPKLGPRLLFMLGRYGFNGSPYATFNSDQWKDDEIDDVLMAVSDFPPATLPVEKSKQLTHFKRGYTMAAYGESKTVANAFILVFDRWNRLDRSHRQSTIVHEIGHYLSSRYRLDDSAAWRKFGKWSTRTTIVDGKEVKENVGDLSTIVSEYGGENPSEDFAESVVAYRYNPRALMRRSPEKYQFLKEAVFDGLEYTSSEACDPAKALSARLTGEATDAVESTMRNSHSVEKAVADINRKCGDRIFQQLSKDYRLNGLNGASACFEQALIAASLETTPTARNLKYKEQTRRPVLDRVGKVTLNPAITAKVRKQIFDQLKASLLETVQALDNEADLRYKIQIYSPVGVHEFCKSYSNFAYQTAAKVIDPVYGSNEFFSFDRREFWSGLANEVCLDIHAGARKIRKPTSEQIEAAVGKRFGN